MEQVFHIIPREVLPDGQNQRPSWKIQQTTSKSISEAWERLQEHILTCPHHGMEDWLILQNFYNGLTSTSKAHIDAAAGGAFFSLIVKGATALIEKMVSNQGWNEDKLQT
jgi:hypothetical protein